MAPERAGRRGIRIPGYLAAILACLVLPGAGSAGAQDSLDALLGPEAGRPATEERPPEPRGDAAPGAVAAEPAPPETEDAGAAPVLEAPARTPQRRAIEEIVVTAQKREQDIRDVPISMSVLGGELLREENITDFRDLALHVPNATIDNNGQFNDVSIRGLGSPLSNKAFEQSVGLVLDGVPYGRREYFVGPIYDVERVEVLRGPQGTLFGKNTTAGLFNVVSRRPTEDFTGVLDLEYGELDRRRAEAAVGGPVLPGIVGFRLSGLLDERDGIIRNTTAAVEPLADERGNARDRKAIRVQAGFPDVLGARLNLRYEHVDVALVGGSWEIHTLNPDHADFFRLYDPNVDFVRGNWVGSQDRNSKPFQKIDLVVADAAYDLGDWRLDALFGHAFLKAGFRESDSDFSPAPMFITNDRDENPQTTFELRGTSPPLPGLLGLAELFGRALGSSDLTLGFFFQRRAIENSEQAIGLNVPVLLQFLAYQAAPTEDVPPLEDFIGQNVPFRDVTLDTSENAGFEETTGFFEQDGRSFAGFGQVDWLFLERWTLQHGMRFTYEEKEATNARETTAGTGAAFSALGLRPFRASLDRAESAYTPKVALLHDWSDALSAFASWGLGFKSGGFNELAANDDDLSNLQFEPERTTAWELGARMRFLDGIANLNLALFRLDAEDLQVFTVQPSTAIVSVTNAGEARSQGVEADGVWLPLEWLTLRGTLAFTDSEFLEFPFGTCTGDKPDTDGDGDDRCDLSGEPLFRTPKWTSRLGASVRAPFSSIPGLGGMRVLSGLDLLASFGGLYKDVHFVDRSSDPRTRQPSFFKFDGGLGVGNAAQGWSLRFGVENLTEEATAVQIREITLSSGYVPGPPTFVQILEPQRLVFGSFRWDF